MWKINCWLASLSVTDTHCNSAVLRQQHIPACPALPSWHLPLVPLKSGFIVPRAGGRNKRMPELWAGWQWLRNSGEARRGLLTPWLRAGLHPLLPAMPHPQGPPSTYLGGSSGAVEFHAPADAGSLSLWPPGAPGTISCSLPSTRAQTLSK